MNINTFIGYASKTILVAVIAASLTGCPAESDYQAGFLDGFLEDEEYWLGYADSYETVPDGPILYSAGEIPELEEPAYDSGYWDGVWFAYNDGYFVCYDYGFTIGFSEGYDLAFREDWLAFLLNDQHPEYLDGSFADGYNDGYSEGVIFGAYDYFSGMPFDWFNAMWDYRDGTDLYIEEAGTGTGEYGPVYLYEYGIDPRDYLAKAASTGASAVRQPRTKAMKAGAAASPRGNGRTALKAETPEYDPDAISYRELTDTARKDLNVVPENSARAVDRTLTLTDTWLDRVNAYRAERTK